MAGCAKTEPADEKLARLFVAKRTVFDELQRMISADKKIGRVGDDVVGDIWFKLDGSSGNSAADSVGLGRDRYGDYLKLLRSIGAYRVSTSNGIDVNVHMYRHGTLVEGRTVDVVFENTPPDPIVDDTIAATVSDNTFAFRLLDDSWYIRREHD